VHSLSLSLSQPLLFSLDSLPPPLPYADLDTAPHAIPPSFGFSQLSPPLPPPAPVKWMAFTLPEGFRSDTPLLLRLPFSPLLGRPSLVSLSSSSHLRCPPVIPRQHQPQPPLLLPHAMDEGTRPRCASTLPDLATAPPTLTLANHFN
jgi:hypothetical protein